MKLLNDTLIRRSLTRKLLSRHRNDPNVLLIDELGLRYGSARIDLAVVNGNLHGYEIKSDFDNLKRLPSQMENYNAVFDRVSLVVVKKHLEEAASIIPNWWGLQIARFGPRGGIGLVNICKAAFNPSLDPVAIAELLWRDEALIVLEKLGQAAGTYRMNRAFIHEAVATALDLVDLRKIVRKQLITRPNWRSAEQRM